MEDDYNPYTSKIRRDCLGEVIERTEHDHPYSFSTHCTWNISDKAKIKADALNSSDTVYSDRLFEANADLYNQSCRYVWNNQGQNFESRSEKDIEKFLKHYYQNQSIILTRIYKSCNQSNGFPCWAFCFSFNK